MVPLDTTVISFLDFSVNKHTLVSKCEKCECDTNPCLQLELKRSVVVSKGKTRAFRCAYHLVIFSPLSYRMAEGGEKDERCVGGAEMCRGAQSVKAVVRRVVGGA